MLITYVIFCSGQILEQQSFNRVVQIVEISIAIWEQCIAFRKRVCPTRLFTIKFLKGPVRVKARISVEMSSGIPSVVKDKPFIAAKIFITEKIRSHLVQTSEDVSSSLLSFFISLCTVQLQYNSMRCLFEELYIKQSRTHKKRFPAFVRGDAFIYILFLNIHKYSPL